MRINLDRSRPIPSEQVNRSWTAFGLLLAVVALFGQLLSPTLSHRAMAADSDRQVAENFWAQRGASIELCVTSTDAGKGTPLDQTPMHRMADCGVCQPLSQMAGGLPVEAPSVVPPTGWAAPSFALVVPDHSPYRLSSALQPRAPPTAV